MAFVDSALIPVTLLQCVIAWLVYRALSNPLRKIPGPFWARHTNLWKAYHMYSRSLPEALLKAHEKYGPVIRIGPNDVDFQSREAIEPIYKAGRTMPKTKFYDGFRAKISSLFSGRDESLHAMRRRQMANSFSTANVLKFEALFNKHINRLYNNVEQTAGKVFDIREYIACYAYDFIGELAFDKDLNTQAQPDREKLPPIAEHTLLACMLGMFPGLLPYSMLLAPYVPIPALQKLIAGRGELARQTASFVIASKNNHVEGVRSTLLDNMLEAKDPETGARLSIEELCSEAFTFLVAGAHTSSSTLGFFFYRLMQNPEYADKLVAELEANLPLYDKGGEDIPYAGLESKLPYSMACIKENFRMNPVIDMPLPRLVASPGGINISGHHMPQGTHVSMSALALHHHQQFWGDDHAKFIPERWLDNPISANEIMHYGFGHRACIGRNIANISILKVVVTLWRNFEFTMVDKDMELRVSSVGVSEMQDPLLCTVRKRES
ncbi:Cytochrome P450 monooxygenase [Cladobotryum mycophilum]|uniref:Cytochrome P450 monooxygenase n=1 Tax=Cladobotryum mycophilum TaxID=491253 RepID=A0ABR0SH84_9HYPO